MGERKIIVLEGPDGVGKSTQAKMLVDKLNKVTSEDWMLVHFPKYNSCTGRIIKSYLDDKDTKIEDMVPELYSKVFKEALNKNADVDILDTLVRLISHVEYSDFLTSRRDKAIYAVSILYAMNRYETIKYLSEKEEYKETNFVFDRYYGSNFLHQGSLFDDVEKLEAYSNWMKHVEFNILKNWVPTTTVFLDATEDVVIKNMESRGNNKDRLEDDENRKLMFKYKDDVLKLFPEWKVVDVEEHGYFNYINPMKDMQLIHYDIFDEVKEFIELKEDCKEEIHDLTFEQMLYYLNKDIYVANRKAWREPKLLDVVNDKVVSETLDGRNNNPQPFIFELTFTDYTAHDWSVYRKTTHDDMNDNTEEDTNLSHTTMSFNRMMSYLITGNHYARRESWEHKKFLTLADDFPRLQEDRIGEISGSVISRYDDYRFSISDYTANDWYVFSKESHTGKMKNKMKSNDKEFYDFDTIMKMCKNTPRMLVSRKAWDSNKTERRFVAYQLCIKQYTLFRMRDNSYKSCQYIPADSDIEANDWYVIAKPDSYLDSVKCKEDDRTELSQKDFCNLLHSKKLYTYEEAIKIAYANRAKIRRTAWDKKLYVTVNEFGRKLIHLIYKSSNDDRVCRASSGYIAGHEDQHATDWEILD